MHDAEQLPVLVALFDVLDPLAAMDGQQAQLKPARLEVLDNPSCSGQFVKILPERELELLERTSPGKTTHHGPPVLPLRDEPQKKTPHRRGVEFLPDLSRVAAQDLCQCGFRTEHPL